MLDELLRLHPELHVHDAKRTRVGQILESLIKDGRHLLHFVTDFDFTLTVFEKHGVVLPTSFGVIENSNRVKVNQINSFKAF